MDISRPADLHPTDVTTHRYEVRKHPTLDEYALFIDDTDDFRIHPDVQAACEAGSYPPLDDYDGSPADAVMVRTYLKNNTRGSGWNIVPSRWDELTEAQMIADGWF